MSLHMARTFVTFMFAIFWCSQTRWLSLHMANVKEVYTVSLALQYSLARSVVSEAHSFIGAGLEEDLWAGFDFEDPLMAVLDAAMGCHLSS